MGNPLYSSDVWAVVCVPLFADLLCIALRVLDVPPHGGVVAYQRLKPRINARHGPARCP